MWLASLLFFSLLHLILRNIDQLKSLKFQVPVIPQNKKIPETKGKQDNYERFQI